MMLAANLPSGDVALLDTATQQSSSVAVVETVDIFAGAGGAMGAGDAPDGVPSFPSVGRSFDAVNRTAANSSPPDTEGAVGLDHIVQVVNGRFRIYDKDGTQLEDRTLDNFWTARAGATIIGESFDPRIQYDAQFGRWYTAAVDNARMANNLLFAVSLTSDPTGQWAGFAIDSDPTDTRWADFPMMGFDNDGVYITANMFTIGGTDAEVNLLVLPKVDLLAGTPGIALRTLLRNVRDEFGFAVQPAVHNETDSWSNFPPYFFSATNDGLRWNTLGGTVFQPTVDGDPFEVELTQHNDPPLARQPGLSNLDSGGERIRSQIVYQNGSYWGVNGIDYNGRAAIRFFQLTRFLDVVQDRAIFAADGNDFIYPSVDVNNAGDVVIGMTVTGPSRFPSAAYLPGTTAGGVTTFPFYAITRNGTDTYQALDGSGRNRWGDYSATHFDPRDDSYFWTFQEYASGVNPNGFTNIWGTDISEISPRGVIPGRLPRSLTTAEGYLVPFGPLSTSRDVTSVASFMDADFDVDSFYVNADDSLRGNGNVALVGRNLQNPAIDPVLALYDADTGEMLDFNDDVAGSNPDSLINFNFPSNSARYIVAIGNKNFMVGGNITGDVSVEVGWQTDNPGQNIVLDSNGNGSTNVELAPSEDSDFFRVTAPANSSGTVTLTLNPDPQLDAELWVFYPDFFGDVRGRSINVGAGVPESLTLNGVTAGQELVITVQSRDFATSGNVTLGVDFITGAPPAPTTAPDLSASYDTGVSNTDNVTSSNRPELVGSVGAHYWIRMYANRTLVSFGLGLSNGTYIERPENPLPDGVYDFEITVAATVSGPESGFSPPLTVTIDSARPVVTNRGFSFETAHEIQFTFAEDVFGADFADLTTRNLTTNTTLFNADFIVSIPGTVVGWRYDGLASGVRGVLPDGNYLSTLAAGSVTDRAGNALAAAQEANFFFLNGDANRDARVNLQDFNRLAANFGRPSGAVFSQADFNYDGRVNLQDFNLLASRFGVSLAPHTDASAGDGNDGDDPATLRERLSDLLT